MKPQEQLKNLEELRRRALTVAQEIMGDHDPNQIHVTIHVFRSPNAAALVDAAGNLGWQSKVSSTKATRWVQTAGDLGEVTIFDDRPVDVMEAEAARTEYEQVYAEHTSDELEW